jgi:transposase
MSSPRARVTFHPRLLAFAQHWGFRPIACAPYRAQTKGKDERGSILLTSNRAVSEWGEVFGDPVVATAILDRLLHHRHVITIRGESYRLKEKRRAGLLTAFKQRETSTTPSPQGVNS